MIERPRPNEIFRRVERHIRFRQRWRSNKLRGPLTATRADIIAAFGDGIVPNRADLRSANDPIGDIAGGVRKLNAHKAARTGIANMKKQRHFRCANIEYRYVQRRCEIIAVYNDDGCEAHVEEPVIARDEAE